MIYGHFVSMIELLLTDWGYLLPSQDEGKEHSTYLTARVWKIDYGSSYPNSL